MALNVLGLGTDVGATYGFEWEKGRNGALVKSVGEGMKSSGLRNGDVIVNINGNVISGPSDVSAVLATIKPGDMFSMTVIHRGAEKMLPLTLPQRKTALTTAYLGRISVMVNKLQRKSTAQAGGNAAGPSGTVISQRGSISVSASASSRSRSAKAQAEEREESRGGVRDALSVSATSLDLDAKLAADGKGSLDRKGSGLESSNNIGQRNGNVSGGGSGSASLNSRSGSLRPKPPPPPGRPTSISSVSAMVAGGQVEGRPVTTRQTSQSMLLTSSSSSGGSAGSPFSSSLPPAESEERAEPRRKPPLSLPPLAPPPSLAERNRATGFTANGEPLSAKLEGPATPNEWEEEEPEVRSAAISDAGGSGGSAVSVVAWELIDVTDWRGRVKPTTTFRIRVALNTGEKKFLYKTMDEWETFDTEWKKSYSNVAFRLPKSRLKTMLKKEKETDEERTEKMHGLNTYIHDIMQVGVARDKLEEFLGVDRSFWSQ